MGRLWDVACWLGVNPMIPFMKSDLIGEFLFHFLNNSIKLFARKLYVPKRKHHGLRHQCFTFDTLYMTISRTKRSFEYKQKLNFIIS